MKERLFNLSPLALVLAFAFLLYPLPYSRNQVSAQPKPYVNIKEEFKKIEVKRHIEDLKEKIKEASKAGKADEVKDLVEDLEAVKGALKDSETRDPAVSDNEAGRIIDSIDDFLGGVDPDTGLWSPERTPPLLVPPPEVIDLMPEGSFKLPPLPEEKKKGKDPEPEEGVDYDKPVPKFQEVIASVYVREDEKSSSNEWAGYEDAATLIERGMLSMEITGTGTTTDLVFRLTNNTDKRAGVIMPTGTLLTTTSEGFQPYQTGYVSPIILGPGETVTTEVPAFCADNDLEPAPSDGSVKYTVQAGHVSPQAEKVTELIVTANALQSLHTTCGDVAEPDDFLGLMSEAFVEDRTRNYEVWNQPLRDYHVQKEQKVSVEWQERSQIKYAHNDIGTVTGYTELTYDDSGNIVNQTERSNIRYDERGNHIRYVETAFNVRYVTQEGPNRIVTQTERSKMEYDISGKLISYQEVAYNIQDVTKDKLSDMQIVRQTERSNIQYDHRGNAVSYEEVGYDGRNVVREERSQVQCKYNDTGIVIGYKEVSFDNQRRIITETERSNIQYNTQGNVLSEEKNVYRYTLKETQVPEETENLAEYIKELEEEKYSPQLLNYDPEFVWRVEALVTIIDYLLHTTERGWQFLSGSRSSNLAHLDFDLSGPLEFPGTTKFSLSVAPELKIKISSADAEGEALFSESTGNVEVSMEPTDNPEIVKFNIAKLEAHADSLEALGESKGGINLALNNPEKSTGTLNIMTGEVRGTVSAKVWGGKYKEPFPAAATYTGKLDFPTGKLSLKLKGTSFEPVKLERGPYQTSQPEKFWDTVHLYSVWGETNKIGKKELTEIMTEQFSADYQKEKAGKLANMVAGEVMDKVKEVQEIREELKEEKFDFSMLDPTLKFRASQPKTDNAEGAGGS